MAIYKRDMVNVNLETGNIHRSFCSHTIGMYDQKADRFGIRVFRDGNPVALTGVSVEGVFMPPQGDPIAITGSTYTVVSGNTAEVILPQACYNYEGQFTLAIKLVDSGNNVTGTIRIIDGMVDNTHASGTVAPTSAVPTYQEVLAAYEQISDALGRIEDLENAVMEGTIIVASSQEVLDTKGDYADADTIPFNTVVTYYLQNDAVLPHAPELNYTGGARAIVVTLSSRKRDATKRNGTLQIWYDNTMGRVFRRTCFESDDVWSEWVDDSLNESTGLVKRINISNNESVNAKRALKAGVPVYFTGDCELAGSAKGLYFNVFGFYNGTSNNEKIVEFGTFSGETICVVPQRDYTTFRINVSNGTISGDYSAWVTVSSLQDMNPILFDQAVNANKNAGLLTRFKAKGYPICKLYGLSGVQNDTLEIRPVKTNNAAGNVTVFGLYGREQSLGYDNLGLVAFGEKAKFTLARAYAGFQTWISVDANDDTIEYEVDATVNLENGIQKEVDQLKLTGLNSKTCNIFHKVVCIGDSYTSGHIQAPDDPTATGTNENYAWPHFMEQLTGNTYINCGISGATTITWQTGARGLAKATSTGLVQAYIIGLMINDSGLEGGSQRVPVGTSSDIGTDNQTYYAQLSKIIREVNAISPLAIIFVNTCPKDDHERFDAYNQAVRDIVEAYASTYPVHCIDLAADYRTLYNAPSLTGDYVHAHYTALGYEQFAEIYAYVLSDYINNHISAFQDVYKIPYDT